MNLQDILAYNTDFKVSGNQVEIRQYKSTQIKGYSVDAVTKENKSMLFNRTLTIRESYESLMSECMDDITKSYISQNISDLNSKLISLKLKMIENKQENFKKSNKRAKTKIMDLVACNADKWKDYNGKKPRVKFLTIGFDPKRADGDLSDYKTAYEYVTKFFKKLSYYLFGIKKNVLKYICVPELHKDLHAFHFHIILFNMPYVKQCNLLKIWGVGSVNIQAVTGSAGKVGKYVSKYLAKSHDENNADFELYERLGHENMKRYSCSRSLIQPYKRSSYTSKKGIDRLVSYYQKSGFLESLKNGEQKYVDTFEYESEERGKIRIISFRINNKKVLDMFKEFTNNQMIDTFNKKEEKQKSINDYKYAMLYDKYYRKGSMLNKPIEKTKGTLRTYNFFKNVWQNKPVLI